MIFIGIAMIWAGYGLGFYGFSLIKGYPLTFKQVFSPFSFYTGPWPITDCAPADQIIPDGTTGPCGDSSGRPNPKSQMPPPVTTPKVNGKCPPGTVDDGHGKCIVQVRTQT